MRKSNPIITDPRGRADSQQLRSAMMMQYQMPVHIIHDNDGYRTTENIQTPIVVYQVAVGI